MTGQGTLERSSLMAGFLWTMGIHTAAVVVLLWSASATSPLPQTYAVKLTAAPAPTTQRRLAAEAVPRPVERVAPPPKPAVKPVTPTPPAKATPKPVERAPATANPATPLPGETPSTGSDVATVDLKGLAFPFPEYLQNIVTQILRRWDRPVSNAALRTDISFTILRDGTVRDIQVTRSSRNYTFDLEARGAVEAAARAGAFGPLPDGFEADALPITFYFKPRTTP